MSGDEAEQVARNFEKWDSEESKRAFIHRMERKYRNKRDRYNYHR